MNDRSRPNDPRSKLQPKYISTFDSLQSQEVGYLINKVKKTVVRQNPPQQQQYYQPSEELPERER